MKRVPAFVLILTVLYAALVWPAPAFMIPAGAQSELERAAAESHVPALAVVIVDPDGIVFARAYGPQADLDAPYLLGSLSKSFTALAIMQLEERGMLSIDDAVCDYLPGIPPQITIRQLLNHTAGYGTYQLPEETKPEHPAGEHIYANINYALLGRVIEAVTGKTYEAYLDENIFAPLDMEHAAAGTSAARANGLIQGYENWFGFPQAAAAPSPGASDWIQPAAGYVSASAADMGRYLQMYLRGGETLLNPENIARMFSESVHVEADIPYDYGFGWTTIREPLSATVYRHSGQVETSLTCMYLLPEQELGIILLADMNDHLIGADLLDRLGWNLVLSILGDPAGVIEQGEYWRGHGLYDLLYILLTASAAASICLLPRFRRKLASGRRVRPYLSVFLLLLGLLVLSAPRLLLQTPLWVVAAFVPDLHLVLWITACLLVLGGALRLWMLGRARARK